MDTRINRAALLAVVCVSLATTAPPAAVPAERSAGKPEPRRAQSLDVLRRLDAGEFNLYQSNNGSFGLDLAGLGSGLYYPRGSSRSVLFAGGLWVGALVSGSPRVTVAEYSQEYEPGRIVGGLPEDPTHPSLVVYKVSRYLGSPDDTAHVERSPAELAADPRLDPLVHHSWGEYLAGAYPRGAPVRMHRLPDTGTPAPDDSVDVLGPDVKGDQMTWCVFNDADPSSHTNSAGQTQPLGIEVHRAMHTFATPGVLGSTAFVEYRIINRGELTLTNLMASHWTDPDLGQFTNDLVGSDPSLGMVYAYDGSAYDTGFGSSPGYGSRPPALGLMVLGGSLHSGGAPLEAYSTNFYVNGTDPDTPVESYNYMQGLTGAGSPVVNPVNSQVTRFVFDGDPVTATGWRDTTLADKRMMISAGPVTMLSNDTLFLKIALLVARGNDRLSSLALLKRYADFVRDHHQGVDRTPKADLAIVVHDVPALLHGCEPMPAEARAVNFGPDIEPFSVRWRLLGLSVPLEDTTWPGLASGASVDLSSIVSLDDDELASELSFFLQVDRQALLPDIDRGNNESTRASTHAVPDLRSLAQVSSAPSSQARVRFGRSWRDSVVTLSPITQYEVYRRAEGPSAGAAIAGIENRSANDGLLAARAAGMQSDGAILAAGWDYVGAVPAHGTSQYSIVVPLLPEVPSPSGYQAFLVRAATATPTLFFDSCVDSMPQVDSLPPATPANLRATGVSPSGDVQLAWDPVLAPDLRRYRVYRGGDISFPTDPAHRLADVTTTGFVDPGATPGGEVRFYKVVSEDFVGNTGEPAVTTNGTVDVGDGAPPALFELFPPAPNPSRAAQHFRFALPTAGLVTLAIHDVAGRLVRQPLRAAPFEAGVHDWHWDGRDSRGRAVPPGVYLVRLIAGTRAATGRVLRME